MTEHQCWSGPAPQGAMAHHAVVDLGEGPVYVDAKVGFGIWLDHEDGWLYGFCR